jgi:8-oxo-dGTP pyrophosphatase MutT (NUDIX family)
MKKNPWIKLSERVVYQNSWLRLREDNVVRPDGEKGIYSVLELPPSVAVVVINDSEETILVGQWRYPLGRYSWEIPMGSRIGTDRSFLGAAKREVREETGVAAKKWAYLGRVDNSNSATTDMVHLWLATQLTIAAPQPDVTEKLTVRWVPLTLALSMVANGEISDACTMVALLKTSALRSIK